MNEIIPSEDRPTDVSDIASELEAGWRNAALQAVQRHQDQQPDEDGVYEITECEDCGDEIPLARLKAAIHNTRCVHCQGGRERRHKLYC